MSYAAVMVHIDAERESQRRIELAVGLADRFRSALIGIAGWSPGVEFATDVAVIDAEPTERQTQEMTARLKSAERSFRAAAEDLDHVEWRGRLEIPLDIVVREARAADLIILGRDKATAGHFLPLDPAAAILKVGRPVLAVPNDVGELAARRIVVAWKDTREARRAVRDALPLLKESDEVLVAEVCEQGDEAEAQKRLDDVIKYLLRHRVAVGAKVYLHAKGTAASELVRFAQAEGADLLVAGAYGHSRLGEWAFGGVTRDLLAGSPICCLLSH